MAFNMATGGKGWRLAGSLIVLGHEVEAAYPDLTCLGTLGNAEHQAQGTASDHNPFILDPNGVGVVRAIDIGGPDASLKALREILWKLYASHDLRMYPFGYVKGTQDNLINDWNASFGTHVSLGDSGHLHVSVTQKNGIKPSAAGYVPAIDSPNSWNLITPKPIKMEENMQPVLHTVGDGPDINQQWLYVPDGPSYIPVQATERQPWIDAGAFVPKGDKNGATITGLTHGLLKAAYGV